MSMGIAMMLLDCCTNFYTDLGINYNRREYDTDEDSLSFLGIVLSFTETQEDFTIEFIPATLDQSRDEFNLTDHLDLGRYEDETEKATAGGIIPWSNNHTHFYMNYTCIWFGYRLDAIAQILSINKLDSQSVNCLCRNGAKSPIRNVHMKA